MWKKRGGLENGGGSALIEGIFGMERWEREVKGIIRREVEGESKVKEEE